MGRIYLPVAPAESFSLYTSCAGRILLLVPYFGKIFLPTPGEIDMANPTSNILVTVRDTDPVTSLQIGLNIQE